MAHGLSKFNADDLISGSNDAIQLLTQVQEGDQVSKEQEALVEALRMTLENQIRIAETLALVQAEFDKFEEGLNKIF